MHEPSVIHTLQLKCSCLYCQILVNPKWFTVNLKDTFLLRIVGYQVGSARGAEGGKRWQLHLAGHVSS